ncbi:woronin body major protein [Helicocarpus griseus UAMH5409]|uniref:Woronin body major protein n=2 Tax=Ajellomycetaceae TaxID=299071 RepID=A0A2B7Y5J5_9EURO|nr:woronin body major protein [Helicocarpus griseus UAMH5409]
MFRRKRASAHTPINPNPSPSAQTAAAQAFRASQANANISTAAAAAALRRHTPTPTSVEDVQTKRMLQRQSSTASNSSGKGKGPLQRGQNGPLHRRGSSGSMTTRTFREQYPVLPSAVVGPGSDEIAPVPPLPEDSAAHHRTVNVNPPYQAAESPARTSQGGGLGLGRSPGAPSPSTPRSPRALNSLPELERRNSRSSINFSYPTHARPNSPAQSPTKNFAARSLTYDKGRHPEERSSQTYVTAQPSEIATSPVVITARENQPPGTYDNQAGGLNWESSSRETTPAHAENEGSASPERRVWAQAQYAHPTHPSPGLPRRGVELEQYRRPSPELHIPKTHISPGDREVEMGKQYVEAGHLSGKKYTHKPTTSWADVSKSRQLDDISTVNQGNKRSSPPPGGGTIDTSMPTGSRTTPHSTSEMLSQSEARGTTSPDVKDPRNGRPHSLSPNRTTRFSSHLAIPIPGEKLHDPPPRSMSPAKSALKRSTSQSGAGDRIPSNLPRLVQALSESSDGTSAGSDDGRKAGGQKRIPRVSFEDEPEVVGTAATPPISSESPVSASPPWNSEPTYPNVSKNGNRYNFSNGFGENALEQAMKPRPALPSFGSVRGRRGVSEDHGKRYLRDESPPRRRFSSDNIFGGMLPQRKQTRPQAAISFHPNEPIPPEITSVEGTGYESMSDNSSSSDDEADPSDLIPPGDSITRFVPLGADKVPGNMEEYRNESDAGLNENENVPVIAVQPATPALSEEKRSSEWSSIPGGFPSPPPLPSPENETPDMKNESAGQPIPVTPESPVSQTSPSPFVNDEESDDSSESVYSDAAENLSDLEDDGFGSINAIVDSPVSHVSSYTHTPPPESPTLSKTDAKRPSDVSFQRCEPRGPSPLGTVYTSGPLPVVEEEVSTSSAPSSKMVGSSGDSHQFEDHQQLSSSTHQQSVAQNSNSSKSALPYKTDSAISDQVPPSRHPPRQLSETNFDFSKQKVLRSEPLNRISTDTTTTINGNEGSQSQKHHAPSSTNRSNENGNAFPPNGVEKLDFGFASKDGSQPALYDSDSSSSFKRARPRPKGTTRYTLRRTMRAPSDSRPPSSGMASIGIDGRPTSPRRPFSSDHNPSMMRTTLRSPAGKSHTRSSSFSGFGRPSKLKSAAVGLNPHAGAKFKSRFDNASDDDDDGGGGGRARLFRSRYEDSSDDEQVAMKLSPVRGIPRRQDEVDGDSTDLEDSSEDETPQNVLRRPRSNRSSRPSILSSRTPVKMSNTKTDGTLRANSDNSTAKIPNGPGSFLPQLPTKQRGLFNRMSLSKRRRNEDAKIRKSELDSAARRDSPLERSRFELLRNKSLKSAITGRDKSLPSGTITDEKTENTDGTTTGPPKQNGIEKPQGDTGSASWPLRSQPDTIHSNVVTAVAQPIPEVVEPSDAERPPTSDGIVEIKDSTNVHTHRAGTVPPATESSKWTSRFLPRLNTRRGTNNTTDENSTVSTQSDAGGAAAFEEGRPRTVNLDFDARVPIPFSVFPSSYRSGAVSETTHQRVEGEVKLAGASRVGREDTGYEGPPQSHSHQEVDVHIHSDRRPLEEYPRTRYPEVELTRERYYGNQDRKAWETQLDITEREYRERTDPNYQVEYTTRPSQVRDIDPSYGQFQQFDTSGAPSHISEVDYAARGSQRAYTDVNVDRRTVVEETPRKMGYYDDEGHYHSFRRGVERAADRVLHPFHHDHRKEEIVVSDERGPTRVRDGVREAVRVVQPRGGHPPETITIPCHFIRVGDLLILQGRPCQVIRISVSPQTGQHRYLGVDLFTRQLHEESSFVSHPSSSVVVQSMLGPVYKTYRILDIREDGRIVAMTETGDVKQGLPVVDQGNLFNRISDAFSDGRGSIRALVINDGGRELVVDYKVIHGSRL